MSLCALAYAASTWKTLANDTHAITIPKLCPTSEELQTNAVKVHFDESKMGGFWYELAMKDITQPRMCSCQTSEKSVSLTDMEIIDDFTIQCTILYSWLDARIIILSRNMVGRDCAYDELSTKSYLPWASSSSERI